MVSKQGGIFVYSKQAFGFYLHTRQAGGTVRAFAGVVLCALARLWWTAVERRADGCSEVGAAAQLVDEDDYAAETNVQTREKFKNIGTYFLLLTPK